MEEQIALARRAVACKGWRWMPGMLALEWAAPGMSLTGGRPVRVDDGWHGVGIWLPDLTDPATLGCLLALVREAWGDECVCALTVDYGPGGVMWMCRLTAGGRDVTRSVWRTEAQALVAALEAAP